MGLLVLSSKDIQQITDLDHLRMSMREALVSVSLGETKSYPRSVTSFDGHRALGIMPAINHSLARLGYKAVSVFKENSAKKMNPHQGIVSLLDYETGQLKCLLNGEAITALRTAAVSAAATELLSREDASTLTLVGAGLQAFEHYRAISRIRDIKEIVIFNRNLDNAKKLRDKIMETSKAKITVVHNAAFAVKEADIIVTCTNSQVPFFSTRDLRPGCHVNAIGACRPGYHEVSIDNSFPVSLFLDAAEACKNEADEIFRPLHGKGITHLIRGEIGEALAGKIPARQTASDITFFKSVGISAEDIFAADLIYQAALSHHVGTNLEF